MRISYLAPLLLLAACAETAGGSGTGASAGAAPTPFDGRYAGTGQVTRAGCGNPTPFPVTMAVTNGRARLGLSGNRSVSGIVAADGTIGNITFAGPLFSGASWGDRKIEDGKFLVNLSSQNAGSYGACTFRYSGQKAA